MGVKVDEILWTRIFNILFAHVGVKYLKFGRRHRSAPPNKYNAESAWLIVV
jgi:hypothetical protein